MKTRSGITSVLAAIFFFIVAAGCISESGPQTGTLSFSSSPTGAEIYLDSQYHGTTPSTLSNVVPGEHTLEFRKNGYTSWTGRITVPAGPSSYYGALSPVTGSGGTPDTSVTQSSPSTPVTTVTVMVNREMMVVGESNLFSGMATGTNSVLLTVFGPGKYTDGVELIRQTPDSTGRWSYTWNPGTSIVQGTYTVVAEDAFRNTSARRQFTVIGGGVVSITPSTYAATPGQTVTFSGQCTTGARNVRLVLFGPGQFSAGAEYPELPVNADQSWSFKYKLDSTMPTGQYTMYVYDSPKTSSGSTQFTVGYAS